MAGMRLRRFLALDGWATCSGPPPSWAGLIAGEPFFQIVELAMAYAGSTVGFLAAALALYLGLKFLQRTRFRSQLRVARLSAGDLKRRLDEGEELVLVDLRHRRELEESGRTLPGALHISPDELDRRHGEIARGPEVVLFCS
jgi:hypothetical protein